MSCPICLEEVCLTNTRFYCTHRLCKTCDAQIQVDMAKCPMCRASRKKFVKVPSSLLRASLPQMAFVFNMFAYSSRDRRRHIISFMMSQKSRSVILSNRKIVVDLMALGYDTFRYIHKYCSEGTGPMRRVSDDTIITSRRAYITLDDVHMMTRC